MLIGSEYKVESDAHNVTLYKKRRSKKPGPASWQAIAFFSSPQNALKYLADLGLKGTGMKDLAAVVKKQEEIYTLISKLKGLPERPESVAATAKDN